MPTKIFHNSKLKDRRRELRKKNIVCKKILWNKLRNKQQGYKFKRQESIGMYVVDFYCAELRLVIEIDGATHSTPEEIAYNKARQAYLESLGLKVKRYLNVDVKEHLSELMYNLQLMCEEIKKNLKQ